MALGGVTWGHHHNDTVNVTKKRGAIAPRGFEARNFGYSAAWVAKKPGTRPPAAAPPFLLRTTALI